MINVHSASIPAVALLDTNNHQAYFYFKSDRDFDRNPWDCIIRLPGLFSNLVAADQKDFNF